MGIFKNLRSWLFNPFVSGSTPISEQQYLSAFLKSPWGQPNPTGLVINTEGSLTISTVHQAVEVISHPISTMEFCVYRRKGRTKTVDTESKLYDLLNWRPNPEQTALKLKEHLMVSALLWGNGYLEIVRDAEGYPNELWNLDPRTVEPQRNNRGRLYYSVNGKRFLPENIIHISRLTHNSVTGLSLQELARDSIALAKSLELFGATYFGNACLPGGFITTDKSLPPDKAVEFERELNRNYGGLANANKIKLLSPGQDWKPATTASMGEQSQFTASRQFQAVDLCRFFNLDPARIGAAPTPTDIEAYNTLFWQTTIQPWAELIEAEINVKLLSDVDRKTTLCEMDFSRLLRANSSARADYLTKIYNLGGVTTNQIIDQENLGEGIGPAGDLHFIPANNLTSLEQVWQDLQTPPVTDDPTPEKTPVIAAAGRGIEAVRAVVEQAIDRMVKRESEAILRAANKPPEEFQAAVETFYQRHREIVAENIAPAVRAFVAVSGNTESAEDLIAAITDQLTIESHRQILSGANVSELVNSWTTKAKQITEVL